MNTTMCATYRQFLANAFRLRAVILMAGLVAGLWSGRGMGATLEIPVLHDAVLYEDATGNSASGAGDFLLAGRNNQGSNSRRRSLLRFDLAALPAGAVITSATLRMHLTTTVTTDDAALALHRVTASWTEGPGNPTGNEPSGVTPLTGDTTWLHASFPGSLWTAPGGDFLSTPSATTTVSNSSGFFDWSGAPVLADVSAWLANPAQNFGWLLRSDETLPQTAKRFESGNNATAAFRPALVLEYTVIPEPCAVFLTALTVPLVLHRKRPCSVKNHR